MASIIKSLPYAVLSCFCLFGADVQARSPADVLSVWIGFDERAGSHYVDVTSLSSQFLCIGDHVFDTERGYISLVSKNGRLVARHSYAHPAPPLLYRGVNLSESYLFLRPGEIRKVFINMMNFAAEPGIYNYRILFPYYLCADIISTRDSVGAKQIQGHVVESSGTVLIAAKPRS